MITRYKPKSGYIEVHELGVNWNKKHLRNTLKFFIPAIFLFIATNIFGWTQFYDATDNSEAYTGASALSILFFIAFLVGIFFAILYQYIEGKSFHFREPDHISITYLHPSYLHDEIYAEAYKDCLDEYKRDKQLFDRNYWCVQFRDLGRQLDTLENEQKRLKAEERKQIPRKNYSEWMKERNEMYMKGLK